MEIVCHEQTVTTRVAGDIQSSSQQNSGGRWLVLKPLKRSPHYQGANGGALPCVRLACVTSDHCVTNEPHLSPQHYKLNAKQHVLDQTRV